MLICVDQFNSQTHQTVGNEPNHHTYTGHSWNKHDQPIPVQCLSVVLRGGAGHSEASGGENTGKGMIGVIQTTSSFQYQSQLWPGSIILGTGLKSTIEPLMALEGSS